MKHIFRKEIIFILIFIVLPFSQVSAHELSSEKLIKELENSSTNIYNECIKKYDHYLNLNPDDVLIRIEKCKFIQNALYDVNQDYNPNQEAFDSCSAALIRSYPEHPDVLLFHTTLLWGDELKTLYEKAEKSLNKNPRIWSFSNRALLYKSISDNYFFESDFNQAYKYIKKAFHFDSKYRYSLEYAKILFELKKNELCLEVLKADKDTTNDAWTLSQKADLLVQLKEYSKAVELYKRVNTIDSLYTDNFGLANTFEGLKQYDLARECLIADTSVQWRKDVAIYNLFKHDLKYQSGATCIESYNQYRDMGFGNDPLSLYRIKIFFAHPFQPWKFRDILGILLFFFSIILLIVIPSVWILPFYFTGHKWGFINRPKPFISAWGLKSFWIVSIGILLGSFSAYIIEPEILYSVFNSDVTEMNLDMDSEAFISLMFFVILSLFAVVSMYKINPKILLFENWTLQKSIWTSLGILLIYRIGVGIYVRIGVNYFGFSIEDITCFDNVFLSSGQDIQNLISVYGKGLSFLFICIIVPLYEEIIFRGVILESCTQYSNFTIANIFQATVFSLLHLNLYMFPVFFIFGIIAGAMRKKSGGLMPGIVFHVGNNVLASLLFMIR